MLSFFGFGSQSNDQKNNSLVNDDIREIFKTLTKEQKAKMFLKLHCSTAVNCFFSLDLEDQKYIFPLLSGPVRSDVLFKCDSVDKDLKNTLNDQVRFYNDHEKSAENSSTPSSFFFIMNKNNALVSKVENQISYSISADKVIDFELNSFKYQRKLMERHIESIANGLEKSLKFYHPITLAVDDKTDTITILDGQHRWNALKKIDRKLLSEIELQFNVIYFPDASDTDIMNVYKNINTSIPIDPHVLNKEMSYINLVDDIKKAFPKDCIRAFNKQLKATEDYPQNFIIDNYLKEELQYINVLDNATPKDIILHLKTINEFFKNNEKDAIFNLGIGESRNVKANDFYLAIKWPKSISFLEANTVKFNKTA